jgi:hypothetical protein
MLREQHLMHTQQQGVKCERASICIAVRRGLLNAEMHQQLAFKKLHAPRPTRSWETENKRSRRQHCPPAKKHHKKSNIKVNLFWSPRVERAAEWVGLRPARPPHPISAYIASFILSVTNMRAVCFLLQGNSRDAFFIHPRANFASKFQRRAPKMRVIIYYIECARRLFLRETRKSSRSRDARAVKIFEWSPTKI